MLLLALFVGLLQSSRAEPSLWRPPSPHPLPMVRVEACKLEWTYKDNGMGPRWAGSAVYDVKTDSGGSPISVILRIELPKFAKVDRFEACLRNWRFEGSGDYVVTLSGGSTMVADGQFQWLVQIKNGDRSFQFRFPLTVVP